MMIKNVYGCPYCGCDFPSLSEKNGKFAIACFDCEYIAAYRNNENQAINEWNKKYREIKEENKNPVIFKFRK